MKFSLIPKGDVFFSLFEECASNLLVAAKKLEQMIDTGENVDIMVGELTELEHRGDGITHQIIAQMNRSFLTPFDREDIASLAHALDDVLDFIHSAADAMLLYKVKLPSDRARQLARVIVQAAEEVNKGISNLRHRCDVKNMLESCVEINRLENIADRIYRSTIADLFENTTQIVEVIKWREIYEHMETATDRCEDVANVLEGVALKHA
ncbi:DUF47 domain-containing protein [Chloroflexota bacterium]